MKKVPVQPYAEQEYMIASSEAVDGNMSVRWEKSDGEGSATEHFSLFLEPHGYSLENTVLLSIPDENDTVIARISGSIDWKPDTHGRYVVEGDGMLVVNPEQSIAAALLTGDCAPLVFTDHNRLIYGVAHGSWKSTDLLIAEVMVEHMRASGSRPEDIHVHIGPSIQAQSYVFEPEDLAQKDDADWKLFLQEREDGMLEVDIAGYNVAQLVASEIPRKNITVSPIDTYSDRRYIGLSHRRAIDDGTSEGRLVTIVGPR